MAKFSRKIQQLQQMKLNARQREAESHLEAAASGGDDLQFQFLDTNHVSVPPMQLKLEAP